MRRVEKDLDCGLAALAPALERSAHAYVYNQPPLIWSVYASPAQVFPSVQAVGRVPKALISESSELIDVFATAFLRGYFFISNAS